MSDHSIDMTDPGHNGVFLLSADELPALLERAADGGLVVVRADLEGCRDKAGLLERIGRALQVPDHFGGNWDALADSLRDLSWLSAPGYLLRLDHAQTVRTQDAPAFDTLLDILAEASVEWNRAGVPFFALVPLPDDAFENGELAPADDAPEIEFPLHGDYVELNRLLKLVGLVDSGGAGKALVASGAVWVDGQQESRKTCKLRDGQRVSAVGTHIRIVAARGDRAPPNGG